MSAEPDVHQLVGWLAAYRPAALRALQQAHPNESALQPGRQLGRLTAPMAVRVAVAAQALRLMSQEASKGADRLATRLRWSHRIEMAAQLVAAAGTGGALAMLLGEGSQALKLAGVGAGLIGSVTAVGVKFLRRDLGGSEDGLSARHATLVKALAQSMELALRLRACERSRDDGGDVPALDGLLNEANALAGQLYLQLKQAGLPAPGLAEATAP